MFEKLDAAPSLSDRVAQTLMDKIDAGELRRGERMPSETVLGQEFGVSRTVIREAISRLRHEGVVEARQGSGVYVTQQAGLKPLRIDAAQAGSIDAVLHIIELRRALEAEGAAMAAQRRTDAQMVEIDAALDGIDAAVAAGGDGVAEDLRFHHAIAAASGNPFLVQALGFFSQYLEEAIGVTRSNEARREDFARQVRDEHRAMVEAIRARDALAARNAAQTHMFNAARRLAEGRDVAQD
ncbi:FadR/GntR family transcriptional regulator [Ralstonia sp. R-29]|uniref:FadR/GntR family transcriptional regulator n=1 Tax=Ralstonia sp. R-29 TaxID=3404059 RepID=UPI003CE8F126